MNYPLISEYIEAIKSAEDNFDELSYLRPVLGNDGQPVMTSGNFAVVFKMRDELNGKLYAVKCFTKEQEGRAEAYKLIAAELKNVDSPYLVPIRFLERELFVDTNQTEETEFPVLLMDWVEGRSLDKYLRENLNDKYALEMLAYRFSLLAQWLIPQPFAHGDLKPDNILVREDGTLVLVDYDGMYVPAMKGQKARELGSPDFRHPQRTENDFDEHIDDFPLISILLSLKTISLDKNLFARYCTCDGLLFHDDDYRNWGNSIINQQLMGYVFDKLYVRIYTLFLFVLSEKRLNEDILNILPSIVIKEQKTNTIYPQIQETSLTKGYEKSVECYAKAAEQGNVTAQFNIGNCYICGLGVPKDDKKAAEWIMKAAKQGNMDAQYELGFFYEEGIGVTQNYEKAVEWYTKAAKQGRAAAQFSLGCCYYCGRGTPENYGKAVEWFTKSAELGDSLAQFELGNRYYYGEGVVQSYEKAAEWYIKAEKNGNIVSNAPTFSYEKHKAAKDFESWIQNKNNLLKQGSSDYVLGILDCVKPYLKENFKIHVAYIEPSSEIPYDTSYFYYESDKIEYEGNDLWRYLHVERSSMGAWQAFLIWIAPTFMPIVGGHGGYFIKEYIFSTEELHEKIKKTVILPLVSPITEFIDGIDEKIQGKEITPSIVLYGDIITISCCYWNNWEGLIREYFMIGFKEDRVVKIKKMDSEVLFAYNCGLKY